MAIRGTTRISCPTCGVESECTLVQSINTKENPADKQRLLDGELNVLACPCGSRTQLAANVLFHDPDADYYCHVCPGGEQQMAEAAAAFAVAGAGGTQRLVPSLNALVEKVKLLDAGLADWAIEMNKVLLLASIGALDRVLLFDALDREPGTSANAVRWMMFDEDGAPESVSSPFSAYEKLAAREQGKPPRSELRIDRAWAIEALKTMIADAN